MSETKDVRVKALEWDENGLSDTSIGVYNIERHDGAYYLRLNRATIERLGTEEEAKAAAQADFEQRIRSALTSPQASQASEVVRELVAAPRPCDNPVSIAREIAADAYASVGNPTVARLMRQGKADHMPGFIAALDVLAIAGPAILEEAAAVADAAAKNASEFALMHPEDSESRFKMNGRAREAYDIATAIRALAHTTGQEPERTCPICAEPFKADDICAADINEGTCHAECLEGSPVVYLDTGEPSDGPVDTFRYGQEGGR